MRKTIKTIREEVKAEGIEIGSVTKLPASDFYDEMLTVGSLKLVRSKTDGRDGRSPKWYIAPVTIGGVRRGSVYITSTIAAIEMAVRIERAIRSAN